MNEKMTKDLEAINAAIAAEDVFRAEVVMLGKENEIAYMKVAVPAEHGLQGGYTGRIMNDEADVEVERKSLVPLVGMVIPFVIIGVDAEKNVLMCSRARAQDKIKAEMVPDFHAKKVFEGRITNFIHFGAYIEVNGVSGLLKNSDFSSDRSEVSEMYAEGDRISVRCLNVMPTGKIMWEVPTKFHRDAPVKYEFEADTVVLGAVVTIKSFAEGSGAFVRIAPGLDALCLMPQDREVEVGNRVSIKISSVTDDANGYRVRGKIVRVL